MNTRQILVNKTQEQKELERIVKGQEIYNSGFVHKVDSNTFLVQGTKSDYMVEKIQGDIYHCECPDFQFRTDIEICKHIIAVQFKEIEL